MKGKNILGIAELSPTEIKHILTTAESFQEIMTRKVKKVPTLRGKTVVNLFFEPSTRTRTSFELAGKRLSADMINISGAQSSIVKGETIADTARNLEALGLDLLVVRHSSPGVPHQLARVLNHPVVNAGDGCHEHPTQALLDLLTIKQEKKRIEALNVAIIGDISHSRVARSDILALTKMGATVKVVAPPTLIPRDLENLGIGICFSLEEVLPWADVFIPLRIQKERLKEIFFPSLQEYSDIYCITPERLRKAKSDVIIMHPGPMNRGIEIDPEVADGKHSVILKQVSNGLAVRMAIFYLLLG